ncbi:MAG: radical SAM protein [Nitrospirales bacterium]|nr:radical SAM protein [Nitrospira sp.]MDR4500163.1 radical SAM protein [Nitrospirales bacterium]
MNRPTLLLVIPPLTQLNTPYPSTAYLTGFLRSRGYHVQQADVGIEMVLGLFSRDGLTRVFEQLRLLSPHLPGEALQMLSLERAYLNTIDPVINFLQGHNPTLAPRICQGNFLPHGPRSVGEEVREPQRTNVTDQAKRLASLYIEDLTDMIQATMSPHFALNRYAESVAKEARSFDQILDALAEPPSLTDQFMLEAFWRHIETTEPSIVGFTVPFPGNVYGAFRMAQALKAKRSNVKVMLGGGYVNTELRRVSDPRVFDLLDYITLDNGERPILCLLEHMAGTRPETALCRTWIRTEKTVQWRHDPLNRDIAQMELGTPTYDGLPLDRYVTILDTLNPMHRLWSDGHWNKLTVAHGCYWKQCTFCDIGLDYIGRYEASPSEVLTDRIETLIAETGKRGFHFVDEAAPPAGLKSLALSLLERGITISWWGNIRFESTFTGDLCRLLAASGCIAVSAGLEAASDRLLEFVKKGITVDQTVEVASAFREAGILIHAYLMYGLPSETITETVESLERVRQMFACDLIQSAFWHRFTATVHSPIGLHPDTYGIRLMNVQFEGFAENDLMHEDLHVKTPEWLGEGLRRALLYFKEGEGLEQDVRSWFPERVPKPRVRRDWVKRVLSGGFSNDSSLPERKFVWVGGTPVKEIIRGNRCRLILPNRTVDETMTLPHEYADWLLDVIQCATPHRAKDQEGYPVYKQVRSNFPFGGAKGFDAFFATKACAMARAIGLLLV